jgi:hypothetical protein
MSDITPPPATPAPSSGGLPPAIANLSSSTLEWVKVGGGLLAVIATFMPWYSVSADFGGFGGFSESFNGFDDGIWGTLVLLLGLAVAALAFIKVRSMQVQGLDKLPAMLPLGLAGALAVIAVFRWIYLLADGGNDFGDVGGLEGFGFEAGTSIGIWLVLIGALAAFGAALVPVLKARKG